MRIFREEFDGWLPAKLLDFHVHVVNPAAIPKGRTWRPGGHPIRGYGFRRLRSDLAALYPGRRVCAVCFGFPDRGFDIAANNRYIAANTDERSFFGLRLLDPGEEPSVVRGDLEAGRFLGIKPYPAYVRGKAADRVEIGDMLPSWAMESVNRLGLVVMLHIPRSGRLADPVNQSQIARLCRRWPNAKIVLAHVGRAYFLRGALGHLERLKALPNLWYDLAMLNNRDVLEHLFSTVDPEKVLYGTDIPIALAPGKSVEINDQYAYVTPVSWELSIRDTSGKLVFTSFAYEGLRAIRGAVSRRGLGRGFLRGLFFGNGMKLLRSAIESRKRAASGERRS